MKIKIGESTPEGRAVHLDVKNLIYSRALIQANSGGGKTGLLRVIAEQVAAHIPTIIIDKEGEYHTLREKVDLILVGERGELAADVRSAGLLARKLVELGASAVIDLSDFTKAAPQHEFVKNFLDALIYLPRSLWHPTFIVIDEAHVFCPEKGMGESEALESVVNLMTLGRKRGFGGILATTRLAKLHKNAADANNIFIGRTVLDVDQQRAVKALGFKSKDNVMLRDLEQRHFYAFGPDLDFNGVIQFRTSDCQTTIPKAGEKKGLIPPAASSVVTELAEKLKDLPQEAEQEIHTLADAKRQVATLSAEIRKLKAGQVPREQDTQRIAQLESELEKAHAKVKTEHKVVEKKIALERDLDRLEKLPEKYEPILTKFSELQTLVVSHLDSIFDKVKEAKESNAVQLQVTQDVPAGRGPLAIAQAQADREFVASSRIGQPPPPHATSKADNGSDRPKNITGGAKRILESLANNPTGKLTRSQLGSLAKLRTTTGTWSDYVSRLRVNGLIEDREGVFYITEAGRNFIGIHAPKPKSSDEILAMWTSTPGISGGCRRMLTLLFHLRRHGHYHDDLISIEGAYGLSKQDLARAVNLEPTTGTWSDYLSRLRSNGLIEERNGILYASDVFFINERVPHV